MARLPFALILILAFPPQTTVADDPVTGYFIEATVKEVRRDGRNENATMSVLASPKAYIIEGREAHVLVGNQKAIGDEKVQGGVSFKVRAKEASEDKISVTGSLEISTLGPSTGDFVVRESKSCHFAKTVLPGKTIELTMSETADVRMWLELRVERHRGE